MTEDPEIKAMFAIVAAMKGLSREEADRVITYLSDRFRVRKPAPAPPEIGEHLG